MKTFLQKLMFLKSFMARKNMNVVAMNGGLEQCVVTVHLSSSIAWLAAIHEWLMTLIGRFTPHWIIDLREWLLHCYGSILTNCNVVAICGIGVVCYMVDSFKLRVVHLHADSGEVITDFMKAQRHMHIVLWSSQRNWISKHCRAERRQTKHTISKGPIHMYRCQTALF